MECTIDKPLLQKTVHDKEFNVLTGFGSVDVAPDTQWIYPSLNSRGAILLS